MLVVFRADPAPKVILIDDLTSRVGSFDQIGGAEGGAEKEGV
jgi:hypothetical protein